MSCRLLFYPNPLFFNHSQKGNLYTLSLSLFLLFVCKRYRASYAGSRRKRGKKPNKTTANKDGPLPFYSLCWVLAHKGSARSWEEYFTFTPAVMLHIRILAYICSSMHAHSGAFQFREIMHCKWFFSAPNFLCISSRRAGCGLREGSLINAVYRQTRAVLKWGEGWESWCKVWNMDKKGV